VGDIDNDGFSDLFITRWRSYALYRNRGDGTFEDITEAWGLGGDRDWPTSAAFADLDGDGDTDLYVCHYAIWDPETAQPCPLEGTDRNNYCSPRAFPALPDHLFRNDGGRFVDISKEAGITSADTDGRGLGVVAGDLDQDGKTDLFVANDMTADFLFLNRGSMRFEEVGLIAGPAANATGSYQAGMGTAIADLDRDGLPDILVTNFYGESTSFFRNLGGGIFADRSAPIGLAASTRFQLGFGLAVIDINDDGRLDVVSNNGHVNDMRPAIPQAMPPQLLLHREDGHLENVSDRAGKVWSVPRLGRGMAWGDLDNDGRLDLVLVERDGPLAFLRNLGPGGNSLNLELEGTDSGRDAVGARVRVSADGHTQTTWRVGGGSFLSASSGRVHVGVGDAARIDKVEIRWPSGREQTLTDLDPQKAYQVREGEPEIRRVAGRTNPSAP
jgi:hypothetical protein